MENGIEGKRVYRWYLMVSIAYSSITLLSGFMSSVLRYLPFTVILYPFAIFWFIFSIVMLVHIRDGGFERIAILIPGLYIVDFIISLAAGMAYALLSIATRTDLFELMSGTIPFIMTAILPTIIIALCVKLLMREDE